MDNLIYIFFLLINILRCDGATLQEQLEHILRRRLESAGYQSQRSPTRRNLFADAANVGTIIGVPSVPSHLPEAEAILPGHTLIRPALGMLKSSIKFPLRELENGAGVYGNVNNIGIRWDGKNERLLNTGFRRNLDDYYRYEDDENYRRSPAEYIMVVPSKKQLSKPSFSISNMILDLDEKRNTENKILGRLKKLRQPTKNTNKLLLYVAEPDSTPTLWKRLLANNDPDLFKQFKEEEENDYSPLYKLSVNSVQENLEKLRYNMYKIDNENTKNIKISVSTDLRDSPNFVRKKRNAFDLYTESTKEVRNDNTTTEFPMYVVRENLPKGINKRNRLQQRDSPFERPDLTIKAIDGDMRVTNNRSEFSISIQKKVDNKPKSVENKLRFMAKRVTLMNKDDDGVESIPRSYDMNNIKKEGPLYDELFANDTAKKTKIESFANKSVTVNETKPNNEPVSKDTHATGLASSIDKLASRVGNAWEDVKNGVNYVGNEIGQGATNAAKSAATWFSYTFTNLSNFFG